MCDGEPEEIWYSSNGADDGRQWHSSYSMWERKRNGDSQMRIGGGDDGWTCWHGGDCSDATNSASMDSD